MQLADFDPPALPPRKDVLLVRGLGVKVRGQALVSEVGFSVGQGELLAVVGPSGSGKSVLLKTLIGLAPGPVVGTLEYRFRDGSELRFGARGRRAARRALGGGRASLVLQSGRAALAPGRALRRVFAAFARTRLPPEDREAAIARAVAAVGLEWAAIAEQSVEALSGGMAQRVMLALASLGAPELVFLDEPSTGLDTRSKARVVESLHGWRARHPFSGLLVTHDPGIARALATRALRMDGGRVRDEVPTSKLPVSRLAPSEAGPSAPGAVLLELRTATVRFGDRAALDGVELCLRAGETVVVIGASGAGKTTLARVLSGAQTLTSGTMSGPAAVPRAVRVLPQNPYRSENAGQRAEDALAEALRVHRGLRGGMAWAEGQARLSAAGLERARHGALLGHMSGGERRRVSLARQFAARAPVFVLDEPARGLDAPARGVVAELVRARRAAEPNASTVVIAHDLELALDLADRVLVMDQGRIVEIITPAAIARGEAGSPVTRGLLDAAAQARGAGAPEAFRGEA